MSLLSDDSSHVSEISTSPVLLAAIVRNAKSGDHHSFEILHLCFGRQVSSRLRQMVTDEEVVKDLYQEALISAWTHLSELKDDKQFKPWLCKIATNLAIDHIRRREKISFLPLPVDEVQEYNISEYFSIAGPEEHVSNAELIELALAQIPRTSRICIILYDACGYLQSEIAEKLGITEKCVSSYLSRGRNQFCKAYRLLTESRTRVEKKGGATL